MLSRLGVEILWRYCIYNLQLINSVLRRVRFTHLFYFSFPKNLVGKVLLFFVASYTLIIYMRTILILISLNLYFTSFIQPIRLATKILWSESARCIRESKE